ncbi:MAG: cadmium-translocating P-type ATPase [Tenericutes bacterium GWC2_34_14]|nr:MAG: cadmium-translocating P-type ATPase [Tenericutes bacterium GWA2_35_7]OHE29089.1 MAG: cadmium-translocating P-type ATPase [Tenericutes bacterium GWC2_34_14]OHE34049.1 MAG: cadmium-translocating P-type ATPase [Tenericutes bacterium GWE2_34_108]OHE35379.1 MAG: cadmium-translocating P-type ATPase [Tenericutes bacterium GWF1_35_14]OHE38475.1 MAG: cadmium-translocating P-type ATPase [Tenericutes bacterium GWF2_35_184]OHE43116.1 MAG: cadmium-translocating P-type ATPase [Tenericutes bacterium 
MKKTYQIKDIDCANCALKIENEVKKMDGVENVQLDFAREKISITGAIKHIDAKSIEKIAQSIEPDVHVFDENEHVHEEKTKLTRKEWMVYGLGLILMALGYLLRDVLSSQVLDYVAIPIYAASYLIFGHTVLIRAFQNIKKGQFFDEHFLMTIATLGAFGIGEFIEGIAVMLFYRVGEYLQDLSVSKSRKSIKSLISMKPTIAHRLTQEGILDVEPEQLEVGDLIVVRPGEKVPVDGIITEGSSWLDTSSITGESMPRDAFEGKEVLSGSINISGLITIQVMKSYENSTVKKIMDFVENNAMKKANAEKFMTKFASLYTPIVVGLALLLAFVVPLLISLFQGVTYSSIVLIYIERALIFLVISCPCALVLSIPLSFFAGIGSASRKGILFKSGSDLEMLAQVKHVVFDKTGTLSEGRFKLDQIVSGEPELILEYAAHAEYHSNHPIARSILEAYGKTPNDKMVLSVREVAGKGVRANYKGIHLLIGNERFMEEQKVKFLKTHQMGTIVYVAANNEFMGYLVIKDQLKPKAKRATQGLLKQHLKVTMVTGDYESEAKDACFKLGIEDYVANCLPEDKVDVILKIKQKEKVAFVGDGINDAPVLTQADVGIAMGGVGSDIAIEASDVVIMNDDPHRVLIAYHLARKTMRIVLQNVFMALGIKMIVLVLGAFGYANMWLAIFADVGVSILAVMNAMRIFKLKKQK